MVWVFVWDFAHHLKFGILFGFLVEVDLLG